MEACELLPDCDLSGEALLLVLLGRPLLPALLSLALPPALPGKWTSAMMILALLRLYLLLLLYYTTAAPDSEAPLSFALTAATRYQQVNAARHGTARYYLGFLFVAGCARRHGPKQFRTKRAGPVDFLN